VSEIQQASAEKPARKQQQRSIRTQQNLLSAALDALSENGFKGTSTRDIAERAGVHHPLITYHFKNKEELWRAAADRIFSDFARTLLQAQQDNLDKCAKTRMAALIRVYVKYAAANPSMHKILVQEASHPSSRLDWLVEAHLRPLFKVAVSYIEELQRLGVAPAGDPALLFNMIRVSSGALLALSTEMKSSSNIDLSQPEQLESLSDMIVRVFLPGDMPAHMVVA
jgi:AcrR family transcriptional regulator